MKKDLLAMDKLPTLEELKEFFKENDWTYTKIDDPAKRTDEERAEIAYTAKLMDKKFEELVRKKGRNSAARYYGVDNPLIALQNNTEDLVASTVVKIANDDELTDAILSQFNFSDPDLDKKADDFLNNAVNTMLDVLEYEKLAEIVRLNSDEQDFNDKVANNYRLKDHVRRWEHTKDKKKNILCWHTTKRRIRRERHMKKIKLHDIQERRNSADEYTLDPTEKYVINLEEEMEFQMAVMMSFQMMGPPPAIKNYHAWLFENGFNVELPNPTNEVVAPYYGVKPLWKTDYSQGIVVMAEDESDYYIVMECSSRNKGYKRTKVILTMGGCL